jgi:hypothetical protein
LATGIQRVSGGDIFFVDTESRRALHYADQFKFRHVPFEAPFGSLDYLEVIKYCVGKGAGVIIVDSLTHEHSGPGGYLLTQEAEIERMAGDDYAKRERVKMAGWIKPSKLRQQFITGIMQLNSNFICCFRAKEKTKPIKGEKQPVEMGFMPIAGEEFLFEMTLNCLLLPKAGGVPTWRSDQIGEKLMMKLPAQFEPLFAAARPLDEDIGRALAEWARGGTPSANTEPSAPGALPRYLGHLAAKIGTDALAKFWGSLSKADKYAAGGAGQLAVWKAIAAEADKSAATADEPDIDFDDDPPSGAPTPEPTTVASNAVVEPAAASTGSPGSSPSMAAADGQNPAAPRSRMRLVADGEAAAAQGLAVYEEWLRGLSDEENALVPTAKLTAWRAAAGRVTQ